MNLRVVYSRIQKYAKYFINIHTGSNSGVGAATAKLFAKEGAKVVISARRLPQLEEVAEEIRAAGGEVLVVQTDVSKVEDCENLVAKTVEAFGKIDVLVNNAGSIINLDSVAGAYGCGGASYVTSKAAVIGLTKHTALRFAGTGIRCNSLNPSSIATPMAKIDPATLNPNMMGQMAKHMNLTVPICMPEDVANILLFLASDESRAITGQVIVSDFGATL
ncbi:MAG: SDR family oxidoreductase [Lachnospiraceae bacterium]|nr:SDR family oxidoreductase [Lachnospiraceae bacterium]